MPDDLPLQQLANIVCAVREANGYKLRDLAQATGFDACWLSRVEQARAGIPTEAAILNLFSVLSASSSVRDKAMSLVRKAQTLADHAQVEIADGTYETLQDIRRRLESVPGVDRVDIEVSVNVRSVRGSDCRVRDIYKEERRIMDDYPAMSIGFSTIPSSVADHVGR